MGVLHRGREKSRVGVKADIEYCRSVIFNKQRLAAFLSEFQLTAYYCAVGFGSNDMKERKASTNVVVAFANSSRSRSAKHNLAHDRIDLPQLSASSSANNGSHFPPTMNLTP